MKNNTGRKNAAGMFRCAPCHTTSETKAVFAALLNYGKVCWQFVPGGGIVVSKEFRTSKGILVIPTTIFELDRHKVKLVK